MKVNEPMNEKTLAHVIESLTERLNVATERKEAAEILASRQYHQGRMDAFAFAIDLIKLWGKVE